jgi:tetratricopeptide (TPR) repeat protein
MGGRTREALGFIALSTLLAALSFGSQLDGEFVWDDAYIVRDNPSLHGFSGLLTNFREDTWRAAGMAPGQFYRPLLATSYWIQAQLGAQSVWPYRLVNIALQLLCGYLLFRLLRRFEVRSSIAAFAGLLFVVHPVVTEPVMWLAGRQEPLALAFTLAAIELWPEPERVHPWRSALVASTFALCALLTKEGYGIAPVLILLTQLAWQRGRLSKAAWARLVLPFGAVALGALLRISLGIATKSAQLNAALPTHLRVLSTLFAYYGKLIFTLDNGATFAPFEPLPAEWAWSLLGALVLLGAWLLVSWWRSPVRAPLRAGPWIGLLWSALAFAPLVLVVPVLGMHQNRYAYFAFVGVMLVLACLGEQLARGLKHHRALATTRVLWAAPIVLLVLATLRTRVEAATWRDNASLYGSDLVRDPHNGYALYHFGHSVYQQEGCAEALPFFIRATREAPRFVRAWNNTAGCLIELGRYSEALEPARRALELSPHTAGTHYHVGVALIGSGELAQGRHELLRALQIQPDHEKARAFLAQVASNTP